MTNSDEDKLTDELPGRRVALLAEQLRK